MKSTPLPTRQSTKTDAAEFVPRADNSIIRLNSQLLNLILLAVSIVAAYFMTIQSLKIELSAKAENAVVTALDKKMAEFEILVRERTVTKEEFYRISTDIDRRLARIEYHLTQPGDTRGTR